MKGTFIIFKGGLKDNRARSSSRRARGLEQTNVELEKMNYLVEGVVGKTE